MPEYTQLGRGAANEGWFIEKSTSDLVYVDSSGTVRFRIDNATGNTTVPGTLATTGATTTTSGVGAVAAEGTLVSELGIGGIHVTEATFTKGTSAAGAALADGARVYTFPAVDVLVLGAHISAGTLTAATETGTPEIGVGSVIGSGANATLGAVGATSEDIIEGSTSEAWASGGTAFARNIAAATRVPAYFAASSVMHVNWAQTYTATETVTCAGTLRLVWCALS